MKKEKKKEFYPRAKYFPTEIWIEYSKSYEADVKLIFTFRMKMLTFQTFINELIDARFHQLLEHNLVKLFTNTIYTLMKVEEKLNSLKR